MGNVAHLNDTRNDNGQSPVLRELQELRQEMTRFRRLFDEFARTYLAAKFPHGKPVDRWRDR